MPTESIDHASDARDYLKKGLDSVEIGNISDAIENFLHAAIEFERAQDFRQIQALWEAIGKLSEGEAEDFTRSVTEKWPLDYHTMEIDEWHGQKEKMHKLAWVYQWAAEHRVRAGDPYMAYPLFFKSAERAELSETVKDYPTWPARNYHRAAINFIRTYGTIEHAPPDAQHIKKGTPDRELIKNCIGLIEKHYHNSNDRSKAYGLIATAHRLLKSALIEQGNLLEAEQYRTQERNALMHYYFHNNRFDRSILEWLTGRGFSWLLVFLFLLIICGFPYIYYSHSLLVSPQGNITIVDAVLYSIETALVMGHDNFSAVGIYGKLLAIIETALSFLGLGVFIWWITKRFE